jgi:hypothetical protein
MSWPGYFSFHLLAISYEYLADFRPRRGGCAYKVAEQKKATG